MHARAQIVAEHDGRGGTRLAVLRGAAPLLMRRTGPRSDADATVHLVGGAAGPLGGDDLRLDVEVGPGARLTVRSVAASIALPGRCGEASRLHVRAHVADGGVLHWRPEPLIAAAGCRHVTVTDLAVDDGGTLSWREDLVCGRHGEAPGDVETDTTLRYAGTTLYRHRLAIGPSAPGWSGAAVLDAGRAIGSLLLAGPHVTADAPVCAAGAQAAVMPLAGPGVLAVVVGRDSRQVDAVLDPIGDVRVWAVADVHHRPDARYFPDQAATAMGTP